MTIHISNDFLDKKWTCWDAHSLRHCLDRFCLSSRHSFVLWQWQNAVKIPYAMNVEHQRLTVMLISTWLTEFTRLDVNYSWVIATFNSNLYCLSCICSLSGQSDVADTIVSRHRNFLYSAQHSHNVLVKNLATAIVYIVVYITHLYPVYIYRVFSVNKGFHCIDFIGI